MFDLVWQEKDGWSQKLMRRMDQGKYARSAPEILACVESLRLFECGKSSLHTPYGARPQGLRFPLPPAPKETGVMRDAALSVAALVVLGVSLTFAYFRLFSSFRGYDDEGYMMATSGRFLSGEALYDDVPTVYGPLYFAFKLVVHEVAGVSLTNESVRWITMALLGRGVGHRVSRGVEADGRVSVAVIAHVLVLYFLAEIAARARASAGSLRSAAGRRRCGHDVPRGPPRSALRRAGGPVGVPPIDQDKRWRLCDRLPPPRAPDRGWRPPRTPGVLRRRRRWRLAPGLSDAARPARDRALRDRRHRRPSCTGRPGSQGIPARALVRDAHRLLRRISGSVRGPDAHRPCPGEFPSRDR